MARKRLRVVTPSRPIRISEPGGAPRTVASQGGTRSLFRDDSALSIEFNLVHTVVSQLDQVAPVFAVFGL